MGEDHAKWSPVATTWYKLMPEVVLLQPVAGELADELAGGWVGGRAGRQGAMAGNRLGWRGKQELLGGWEGGQVGERAGGQEGGWRFARA